MTRIPRRSIAATKIETKESTPVRVADTPASGGHKNMKMKRLNASPEKNICRLHGFSKIVVQSPKNDKTLSIKRQMDALIQFMSIDKHLL